ncbi:hypothetical protein CHS0354_042883 [Potamilus streckersoni]|uniref:protein disulfide-isomerase n=1 Tax=Potamilus streckersoni TaxID=2493646 RepID=A0AAE0T4Y5_9BIVA|nr:hypothetical protein CHS0354_042883 [Potamilus streckersoni]
MILTLPVIGLILQAVVGEVLQVDKSNFDQIIKKRTCVIFYVTQKDCKLCTRVYYKFLAASQVLESNQDVVFAATDDPTVTGVLNMKQFPGIAYYEFGSAIPKSYDGDITTDTIIDLVIKAMRGDFSHLKRRYTVELTLKDLSKFTEAGGLYKFLMLYEHEKDDEVQDFEEVAGIYKNEYKILFGRVNVKKNKETLNKFHAETFPALYWFSKDSKDKQKRYGGEINMNSLLSFIGEKTGLRRLKGGYLHHQTGVLKPFDEVIEKHIRTIYDGSDLKHVVEEAEKLSKKEKQEKDLANYYVHILKKIEDSKTVDVLDEERNRINRQMENANVGPIWKERLTMKKNIVNKVIDSIGMYLLAKISGEEQFAATHTFDLEGADSHPMPSHEEL